MTFKPTQSQRSVLLALKFMPISSIPAESQPAETMRVSSISALFAGVDDITVEIFTDRCEATLLRRFWQSIRADDRIFAANVAAGISMLRRRAWTLDVLPSPEIDLRCVYCVELNDTGRMWTSGFVPYPLHVDDPGSPLQVEAPIDEESEFVHSRD